MDIHQAYNFFLKINVIDVSNEGQLAFLEAIQVLNNKLALWIATRVHREEHHHQTEGETGFREKHQRDDQHLL
jgi:hypothetical protein